MAKSQEPNGTLIPTPRANAETGPGLNLVREERQILARADGRTSLDDLARKTSLSPDRVREIINRLVDLRLIDLLPGPAAPTSGPRPAVSTSGPRPSVSPTETTRPRPAASTSGPRSTTSVDTSGPQTRATDKSGPRPTYGAGSVEHTGPRPATSADKSGPRAAVPSSGPRSAAEKSGPRASTSKSGPQAAKKPAEPLVIKDMKDLRAALGQILPRGQDLEMLVEFLFLNLEHLSYYDLLGIPRNSETTAVKKGYLTRTKCFHPDRYYRRADSEFKNKLQEIFKQLNKGYKVLADAAARAEYDASLGPEEEEPVEEVMVAPVLRERVVKGATEKPGDANKAPIREKIAMEEAPEAPRAAQPKLKLGFGKPAIPPNLQRFMEMKAKSQQATASQAERLYQGAMAEKARGKFASARLNLKLAMQYAPWEPKYKQAFADLDKDEEGRRSEIEFQAGLEAQKGGDLHRAKVHYAQALHLGYENAKLYHKFAELEMELEGNYEKARILCLKAIEMQAGVAEFHFTLARAYKGLGQRAAAIIQLEKVVGLDPKNKLAAKELKSLKRS